MSEVSTRNYLMKTVDNQCKIQNHYKADHSLNHVASHHNLLSLLQLLVMFASVACIGSINAKITVAYFGCAHIMRTIA